MNRLSSFGDFALTRSEMKGVRGGTCYYQDTWGDPVASTSLKKAKSSAASNDGTGRYCCDSCATSSWCKGC